MLLILVGVALATLTGQGNIIGNAENAVGKYNDSVVAEQQLLNEIERYFQNYLEGENGGDMPTTPDTTPKVDENGLATENVIITTDETNVQIVIPTGFAPAILATGTTQSGPGDDGSVASIMPYEDWNSITSEQINQGIVIVDHAITYDGGNTTGILPDFNEYVWVPIPNIEENFQPIAWNGPYYANSWKTGIHPISQNPINEEERKGKYWDDYTTQEYQYMIDSVEEYKGFYIGRYEAGEGTNNIALSKRNISPWIDVSQLVAKEACASMATDNIKIHLMYGVEWDSVLNWLKGKAEISSATSGIQKTMEIEDIQNNSSSWGNHENSTGDAVKEPWEQGKLQNTGASEYWKANNIYDIAGNVFEWTQEKLSTGTNRAFRGGKYNNDGDYYPAAYRDGNDEGYKNSALRFS